MENIDKDDNQVTVNVQDQFYPFPLQNQTNVTIIRNIEPSYQSG